jgi:hypothetical protein
MDATSVWHGSVVFAAKSALLRCAKHFFAAKTCIGRKTNYIKKLMRGTGVALQHSSVIFLILSFYFTNRGLSVFWGVFFVICFGVFLFFWGIFYIFFWGIFCIFWGIQKKSTCGSQRRTERDHGCCSTVTPKNKKTKKTNTPRTSMWHGRGVKAFFCRENLYR